MGAHNSTPTDRSGTSRLRAALRGGGLALVPLVVCMLLGALMLPSAAVPDDVPLPLVDERALSALELEDESRAKKIDEGGLSGDVRALGSDLRAFHELQAEGAKDIARLLEAKDRAQATRARVMSQEGPDVVRNLFALQLQKFRAEVASFAASGEESLELRALSGTFIARARSAGWITGRTVLLSSSELRVLYKGMWSLDMGLEGDSAFALGLEERKVLYRLFLSRPHPSEQLRSVFLEAKRRATSTAECGRVQEEEHLAAEKWRIQKIVQLSEFDPSYPKDYALGAAYYRAGDFAASASAYGRFLDTHPDGPLVLRARNFHRAALAANQAALAP